MGSVTLLVVHINSQVASVHIQPNLGDSVMLPEDHIISLVGSVLILQVDLVEAVISNREDLEIILQVDTINQEGLEVILPVDTINLVDLVKEHITINLVVLDNKEHITINLVDLDNKEHTTINLADLDNHITTNLEVSGSLVMEVQDMDNQVATAVMVTIRQVHMEEAIILAVVIMVDPIQADSVVATLKEAVGFREEATSRVVQDSELAYLAAQLVLCRWACFWVTD